MDARNSLLAMVLFLLAVLLIAPMAIYNLLRSDPATEKLESITPETSLGTPPPRGSGPRRAADDLFTDSTDDVEKRLRELIDKKNEQLSQQRDELTSKEQAYQQLKSDYDGTLQLFEEFLGDAAGEDDAGETLDGAADASQGAKAVRTREEVEAELKRLRGELDAARLAEMTLTLELRQLREASALEMAEAQLAAQQALDEERMLQQVASQALIESGEAALPILVLMLRDERPRIRVWAADVLGGMGPRAGDAVTPLSETASADADERVRDSARRALRAIRD
ncbi:MAG: HEAT repeat domain-containing protein [Pirellulaceae bacterium]